MAAPDIWAVREVALASFYDISTNKAKIQLSNLKTSGIENSAETVYAMGGRGNAKVLGFSGNRGGKISLQDCLFSNEVIAMMTGNGITSGVVNVYQREVLTVAANKVSIAFTPVDSTNGLVSVYVLNADGTHGTEITFVPTTLAAGKYTLAAKLLTFFTGELADGAQVVAYYKAATAASSKKITVSSDKFAGTYRVVLDCLVRSPIDEKDYAAQIVINKAKMEDNWSISMAAEGEPSVFDIPMEILKPVNSTELYTMTIYDAGALV